jgi:hypothetical protein
MTHFVGETEQHLHISSALNFPSSCQGRWAPLIYLYIDAHAKLITVLSKANEAVVKIALLIDNINSVHE